MSLGELFHRGGKTERHGSWGTAPVTLGKLLIPILCLYMKNEDKKNLPYRGAGEWTDWRLGWRFEDEKGSCQDGYSLSQNELCGSEGVLHPDLLLPLFLKTIFTWATSTSACLIPSPAILPHLWKKSAMSQLNHSIKEWNFEQRLPSLHWGHLFPGNRAHNKFRHSEMKYQLTLSIFRQYWGNKHWGKSTEKAERCLLCKKLRDLNNKAAYLFLSDNGRPSLSVVSGTSVRPVWWKTSLMDESS